jgi:hypothetical protein
MHSSEQPWWFGAPKQPLADMNSNTKNIFGRTKGSKCYGELLWYCGQGIFSITLSVPAKIMENFLRPFYKAERFL